jgi:hypothetical protein
MSVACIKDNNEPNEFGLEGPKIRIRYYHSSSAQRLEKELKECTKLKPEVRYIYCLLGCCSF